MVGILVTSGHTPLRPAGKLPHPIRRPPRELVSVAPRGASILVRRTAPVGGGRIELVVHLAFEASSPATEARILEGTQARVHQVQEARGVPLRNHVVAPVRLPTPPGTTHEPRV